MQKQSLVELIHDLEQEMLRLGYTKNMKVHMLRHSKAMHLLQAGVYLICIRDFLGHCGCENYRSLR